MPEEIYCARCEDELAEDGTELCDYCNWEHIDETSAPEPSWRDEDEKSE